ncbi:hypothetical protein BS47DRAFT_1390382 [Hydnum rufescens UP504]|uniref:Chitin biosynthesis protein n=1 Tax=Hydnum rufescens UP504 TaxID=1448309 RepID=A0A9P6B342_9AGAM|nr:hypothetical protein BS47DRAFT_1390382 [Hydnum rufescens UP504]
MTMAKSPDSFTFTVGKLDAGMAILIGERAHLIEFPSLLLPPGVTSGSIVNIAVHQNLAEEKRQKAEFWDLQDKIYNMYGRKLPEAPKLSIRNVTQTSVTLEWPQLELAKAKLRSLEINRNGLRLAAIPSPLQNTSTKLSGLSVQTKYTFQLILRTTAGVFHSNVVEVITHAISDTSGISVCFGNVSDPVLLESAKIALNEMKAKWSDRIQIDTTHFVCTSPAPTPSGAQAAGNVIGGTGVEYQKALSLSIPVVQPQWLLACLHEKKMVPISSFYLGATPSSSLSTTTFSRPKSQPAAPARSPSLPTSPPPPSKDSPPNPMPSPETQARTTVKEEEPAKPNRMAMSGSRDCRLQFKFPPETPVPSVIVTDEETREANGTTDSLAPEELAPPLPIKESVNGEVEDLDEEVGETEEIDLS